MTTIVYDGAILAVESYVSRDLRDEASPHRCPKCYDRVDHVVRHECKLHVGFTGQTFRGQAILAAALYGEREGCLNILDILKKGMDLEKGFEFVKAVTAKLRVNIVSYGLIVLTESSAWDLGVSSNLHLTVKEITKLPYAIGTGLRRCAC